MNDPALRPLACARCGAVLALGQGKTTRCAYCGTDTPVPEEYATLQRAAQSFAADRNLARQLYGDLGEPPGWFVRAWGRGAKGSAEVGVFIIGGLVALTFESPLVGVPMIAAAAYALGYPVAALMRGVGWLAGGWLQGPLSPFLVLAVTTLVVTLLVAVPAVIFGKERALAAVRRDVHASLAAALPERPGGPSRCRSCGAALDVPDGARGVPCPYCKADNLVALPHEWVTTIQASEFHHFLRIDAALEAFREASRVAQESLWQLVFGLILVFPVAMGIAWFLDKLKFYF